MRHKQKHVTNIAGPRCRWVAAVIPPGRGEVLAFRRGLGRVCGGQGKPYGLARAGKEARSPGPQSQTPSDCPAVLSRGPSAHCSQSLENEVPTDGEEKDSLGWLRAD